MAPLAEGAGEGPLDSSDSMASIVDSDDDSASSSSSSSSDSEAERRRQKVLEGPHSRPQSTCLSCADCITSHRPHAFSCSTRPAARLNNSCSCSTLREHNELLHWLRKVPCASIACQEFIA